MNAIRAFPINPRSSSLVSLASQETRLTHRMSIDCGGRAGSSMVDPKLQLMGLHGKLDVVDRSGRVCAKKCVIPELPRWTGFSSLSLLSELPGQHSGHGS